jgi:hypothetical protein
LFWAKYGEVFPSVHFLCFSPLIFHGVEMLTNIDWTMHAKATRSMAFRSLRHGETETAKRLFQAASRMETIAREAVEVPVADFDTQIGFRQVSLVWCTDATVARADEAG